MSKMLENSQKSQIPDNNKEETNMSLALSLENEANQGSKGNQENQSANNKFTNINQTSGQAFQAIGGPNLSSIEKISGVNPHSQSEDLKVEIDIFNNPQDKVEQYQDNQENMGTNKLDNQNVKNKLKESLEKNIEDYTKSIDLEKDNNLQKKDEQREKHQMENIEDKKESKLNQMENKNNNQGKKQLPSQEQTNQEVKDQKKHTENIESGNNLLLNIANAVNESKMETKNLNSTLSDFITQMKKSLDNQNEINESIKKSIDNQQKLLDNQQKSIDNQQKLLDNQQKSLENQQKSIEEIKSFNNLVFKWMKDQKVLNNEKNGENPSDNIPK